MELNIAMLLLNLPITCVDSSGSSDINFPYENGNLYILKGLNTNHGSDKDTSELSASLHATPFSASDKQSHLFLS